MKAIRSELLIDYTPILDVRGRSKWTDRIINTGANFEVKTRDKSYYFSYREWCFHNLQYLVSDNLTMATGATLIYPSGLGVSQFNNHEAEGHPGLPLS